MILSKIVFFHSCLKIIKKYSYNLVVSRMRTDTVLKVFLTETVVPLVPLQALACQT